MDKKSSYIIGVVALAIIGGIFMFSRSKPSVQPSTPTTGTALPANAPAIIKAVMSKSIDAKGNATGAVISFNAKTDKIVYAVFTLERTTKNTKLSYVRYLNGKYVDSKVVILTKDGITTFYFAFEKGIGDYPKGTYTLKLYVNGRYSQSLAYVFK